MRNPAHILLPVTPPLATKAGFVCIPQIKRMDMEARSFSADRSRQLLGKVRDYKTDLVKLQEEVRSRILEHTLIQYTGSRICAPSSAEHMQVRAAATAASGGAAARAELGLGDDFYATSSGQRERMLQSTEKLANTGDRINQGRQQLLETEVRAALLMMAMLLWVHSTSSGYAGRFTLHGRCLKHALGGRQQLSVSWRPCNISERRSNDLRLPCEGLIRVCSSRKRHCKACPAGGHGVNSKRCRACVLLSLPYPQLPISVAAPCWFVRGMGSLLKQQA